MYKLPTDRIYATYFGGDEKSGLAPDTESKNIWLQYLPEEKVLPFECKVQCMCCVYWSKLIDVFAIFVVQFVTISLGLVFPYHFSILIKLHYLKCLFFLFDS